MVESEKMIEDNKDALIDVVNDMYGPPHKLPKEQDRTVAAGKAEIIENHGKLAQNKRPSRDFDTARQGKPLKQKPSSQDARGLIEVEGRTPLHIRLAVYDQFENGEWLEGRKPANRLFESENEGGAWMQLRYLKEADWYSVTERHALKVADLESNLVPTPSLLTRFYIHRVDRADYYEWSYHGVLVLSGRRKTPSGVIVRTDCQTVQSENLPLSAFVRETAATPRSYSRLPDELLSALQPIASEWAGALPPGWPQVEAILDRLRNDYTLDPEVVPPKGHPAPVLWFLLESHRGPDYLFASAAALLLRSLDYSTRFCMGYYASPDAYDPGTQHTPVRASDFHAWPEILLRDGHWMVIEPTPGFEVLAPVISWGEWLGQQFGAWLEWAKRNFVLLVLLTLSLGAAIRWRRQLIDRVHTLFWRLSSPRNWQQRTLQTVQLLEKRARLVGCDRLATETLQHWCQRLECGTPSSLQRIVRFSEWAAYGPAEPPATREELETVCREVLREWSLTRMIGDR
jgi:transglutaminase-like putative cysteine protease